MSLPNIVPTAVLETILIRLAVLFLAGAAGDEAAARDGARQMLAAQNPETEAELRLAANIVSFGFHALEALSQACTPDMPITRVLRLRGSAVSLSREAQKAENHLEALQTARRQAKPAQPQTATPPQPHPEPAAKAEKAIQLIEDTRKVASYAKANDVSFSRALEEQERDKRIAASIARAEAKLAAINAAEAQARQSAPHTA